MFVDVTQQGKVWAVEILDTGKLQVAKTITGCIYLCVADVFCLGSCVCVDSDWVSENRWMMSCQGKAAWRGWLNVCEALHCSEESGCNPRHYFTQSTSSIKQSWGGGMCVWDSTWMTVSAVCVCVCVCTCMCDKYRTTEAACDYASLILYSERESARLACLMTNFNQAGERWDVKLVHVPSL